MKSDAAILRLAVAVERTGPYGRRYIFFPLGGSRVRRRDQEGLPWASGPSMLSYLEQFPSRGAAPRTLGMGHPPDAAAAEDR